LTANTFDWFGVTVLFVSARKVVPFKGRGRKSSTHSIKNHFKIKAITIALSAQNL
jgi:hypothetical protein